MVACQSHAVGMFANLSLSVESSVCSDSTLFIEEKGKERGKEGEREGVGGGSQLEMRRFAADNHQWLPAFFGGIGGGEGTRCWTGGSDRIWVQQPGNLSSG